MKPARLIGTLLSLTMLVASLNSCDVHEFPDGGLEHEVVLALSFDRDLPVHRTVEVETRTASKSWTKASDDPADYDLRHVVQVYRADQRGEFDRTVFRRLVFTRDDITLTSDSLRLTLPAGEYRFIVWSDNVVEGDLDFFYNTQRFEEVLLQGEHIGCNDLRDAFRGSGDSGVRSGVRTVVPLGMERPMAKYTFISTDFEEFRTKVLTMLAAKAEAARKAAELAAQRSEIRIMQLSAGGAGTLAGDGAAEVSGPQTRDPDTKENDTRAIDLEDFRVVFTYSGFMPSAYNLYTMRPADARTGVSFETRMSQLDDDSAQLGFDYVLVNGDEASVNVTITTYDMDGNVMARSEPYEVPLMRSRHTIVRGRFLTTMSSGSVGIDPGFYGDFDVPVL